MNKRIREKHMPRFNMYMLRVYAVLHRFEIILGHKVEHKTERRLSNMIKRNWYKNRRNTENYEDSFKDVINDIQLNVFEQLIHSMDKNKSMEESINE